MSVMKKIVILIFALIVSLICLVGCGSVVDGPGMVNTEYDQGY